MIFVPKDENISKARMLNFVFQKRVMYFSLKIIVEIVLFTITIMKNGRLARGCLLNLTETNLEV